MDTKEDELKASLCARSNGSSVPELPSPCKEAVTSSINDCNPGKGRSFVSEIVDAVTR